MWSGGFFIGARTLNFVGCRAHAARKHLYRAQVRASIDIRLLPEVPGKTEVVHRLKCAARGGPKTSASSITGQFANMRKFASSYAEGTRMTFSSTSIVTEKMDIEHAVARRMRGYWGSSAIAAQLFCADARPRRGFVALERGRREGLLSRQAGAGAIWV